MKKFSMRSVLVVVLVVISLGLLYLALKSENVIRFLPARVAQVIENKIPTVADSVPTSTYIEVTDSCDFAYVGDCVNVRSGPGVEFPVVMKLRNGIVLFVADKIKNDAGEWYKIGFVHELLYPERVKSDWYVSADLVKKFKNEGDHLLVKDQVASTTKHIVVDVSEQKLYAYDGDVLFMEESISTGLEFTPTPRGTFQVFKMTPSRFMQGPIPGVSDQVYDLPGVPWNLYFTEGGAVIHGAYWHESFGQPWSHGCVNLPVEKAKKLYSWAVVGMPVVVRN